MTILQPSHQKRDVIYFVPRPYAGFANNARALRGIILFCLLSNKSLQSMNYDDH